MKFFPNKYKGLCFACEGPVPAYSGLCFITDDGFRCGCKNCYPSEYATMYGAKIAAEAKAAKQAEERAAADERARLLHAALLARLKIDFENTFDSVTKQQSWSDDHVWKVRYEGDGTEDEFRRAVATPSQSLYGQLRASAGRSLVAIDRAAKVLTLSESVRLCD